MFAPTRRLASALLVLVARAGLSEAGPAPAARRHRLHLSREHRVIGALRRAGRIRVPCIGAITDSPPCATGPPGDRRTSIIHAESRAEVLEIAGPARRCPARPRPVAAGFEHRPPRAYGPRGARRCPSGQVVLVSGGGWGLGDVEGAARRAGRRLGAAVVCLCGTNTGLRTRLGRAFAGDPLVRVEGFTDAMCA